MRSTKKYMALLCMIVTVSLVLGGCGGSSPQQASPSGGKEQAKSAPVTLSLSYPQPESSFYGVTYGYLAKTIEEESGGTIKVKVYPAATLVGDSEVLNALILGNVDMAHVFSTYASPAIPDLLPLEVPGAYPGDQYEKLNAATFDIVDRILAKKGLKFVALSYPDTIAISSTKNLVKSPQDLKGMAIRSSGKWPGEAIRIWGGSPVTIPIGDVSVALERRTVSAVYTSWMMTQSYKFYESAKNVTFTGLQNSYYGVVMNLGKWQSLSAEQQAAIKRAADKFRAYSQQVYNDQRAKFEKTLAETGAKWYSLTREENLKFVEPSMTLMEQIKKMISPDGLALIDAMASMYK